MSRPTLTIRRNSTARSPIAAPTPVPIADPNDDSAELQRDAYPDIVSRQYPVGTQRVFDEALTVVTDRGWRLLDSHSPDDTDATGRIEAVARTTIFGFSQDVVIRIQPDGDGALVDMRSAARHGAHDLGADAERIRAFFRDLDAVAAGRRRGPGQLRLADRLPSIRGGPSVTTRPRATRSSSWARTERAAAPWSAAGVSR